MNRPFEGLLVVAIEHAVAAPYASCRLADAGARVIKIERASGDFSRHYDDVIDGESSYFIWLNRGKESVVLDFRDPGDMALLQSLISRADVVIQNLGPGAAERAGFGWKALREKYPRLITCDISGYGEEGPYAQMPAYDLMVQAESGLISVSGPPETPGRVGISACDIGTGMYAYQAIVEALYKRERTGEGSAIALSLFGAMTDWMAVPLMRYDHAGLPWPRLGLKHPTIVPYGEFSTGDGRTILVGVQCDPEWVRLARDVLQSPALAEDERYRANVDRAARRTEVEQAVQQVFDTLTFDEIAERMRTVRLAHAAVNDVAHVCEHPQLRRMTVKTPKGETRVVRPPAIFRNEEHDFGPVPTLGEHTESVRSEFMAQ
jgi:crotonobetainyl-CoA:carnitine CoA-transferase CaiB-like acyl-CoA transferase